MAVNTCKAIKERKAQAVKELRDVHDKLSKAESGSDEFRSLSEDFDARSQAIQALDDQLTRAARLEGLAGALGTDPGSGSGGGPGTEDRTFGDDSEKDDLIANLDSNKYSVLRAVNRMLEGRSVNGYEGEISQELEKRFGGNASGFVIPWNLRVDMGAVGRMSPGRQEKRDLNTTEGAGALPTIQAPTMIEMLRKRIVVRQAGATVLTDLVGTFDIPKETSEPTFYWVAESAAGTESDGSIGKVTFTPKTVTAWTTISRRFAKQSGMDAEAFTRYQLMAGLARAVDYGALAGPGTANNVEGLINNTSTNLVAMGTNGAAPDWAKIVEMESAIAADNADIDSMTYLFNAVTRGKLKTVEKASGTAQFLWGMDNTVNGYGALTTNQLPSNLTKGSASGVCSAGVFGAFSQLMIGMWGGPDILVDPFTEAPEGNIRVTIHQDMDIQNRHDEAFSRVVDFLTT